MDIINCPKCGETSGNSWTQCGGSCPMLMSPHYNSPVDKSFSCDKMSLSEKLIMKGN